jgi:hypothetical protein
MTRSGVAAMPAPTARIASSARVVMKTQTMKLALLSLAVCEPALRNSAAVTAMEVAPITTPARAQTVAQPIGPIAPRYSQPDSMTRAATGITALMPRFMSTGSTAKSSRTLKGMSTSVPAVRGTTTKLCASYRTWGRSWTLANRFTHAKVEHLFRVMKCQFGYRKVRYRGIVKNGAQVFSLLALANLYLARRTLASA